MKAGAFHVLPTCEQHGVQRNHFIRCHFPRSNSLRWSRCPGYVSHWHLSVPVGASGKRKLSRDNKVNTSKSPSSLGPETCKRPGVSLQDMRFFRRRMFCDVTSRRRRHIWEGRSIFSVSLSSLFWWYGFCINRPQEMSHSLLSVHLSISSYHLSFKSS
jgi:hypothetical protein